jgi:hypothetical protein
MIESLLEHLTSHQIEHPSVASGAATLAAGPSNVVAARNPDANGTNPEVHDSEKKTKAGSSGKVYLEVKLQDLHITKYLDAPSPAMRRAATNGQHCTEAKLSTRRSDLRQSAATTAATNTSGPQGAHQMSVNVTNSGKSHGLAESKSKDKEHWYWWDQPVVKRGVIAD